MLMKRGDLGHAILSSEKNEIATLTNIQMGVDQEASDCTWASATEELAAHETIPRAPLERVSKPYAEVNSKNLGLPSVSAFSQAIVLSGIAGVAPAEGSMDS